MEQEEEMSKKNPKRAIWVPPCLGAIEGNRSPYATYLHRIEAIRACLLCYYRERGMCKIPKAERKPIKFVRADAKAKEGG